MIRTYGIELHPDKRVITALKLSTGEIFNNVQEFHKWAKTVRNVVIHGERLNVLHVALKSVGIKFKAEENGSMCYTLTVGGVHLINVQAWRIDIDETPRSVLKIGTMLEKFRIRGGKLPSSPSRATLINFTSKTRNLKADPVNITETLAGSTTYGKLLGYDFIPAYRGGLLGNPAEPGKLYENVKSYDLDSAYPAAIMTYNYPKGASEIVPKEELKTTEIAGGFIIKDGEPQKTLGYIGVFRAVNVRRRDYVSLPCLQVHDGNEQEDAIYDRLGVKGGTVIFGACTPEMAMFQEQYDYDRLEILELSTHRLAKLSKSVRKWVGELYSEKMTTTGDEKSAVKLMLNSLIGCWGRDPLKDNFGKYVNTMEDAEYSLQVYNGTETSKPLSLSAVRTWDYRWAIWLNSYVRYYLHKTAKDITEAGAEILYADTDSVKLVGPDITEVIEKRNREFAALFDNYDLPRYLPLVGKLGNFKDESAEYQKAIFYTRRGYIKHDGETITPVVAGARKFESAEQLNMLGIDKITKMDDITLSVPTWRRVGLKEKEWGAEWALQLADGIFTLGGEEK